jgi:hypothetical protein
MLRKLITSHGIPFNVVLDTTKDEPIVSFYDARWNFTEYGQFTGGSYYASKLLEDSPGGLFLDRGTPDWRIDHAEMREVLNWLSDCLISK